MKFKGEKCFRSSNYGENSLNLNHTIQAHGVEAMPFPFYQ